MSINEHFVTCSLFTDLIKPLPSLRVCRYSLSSHSSLQQVQCAVGLPQLSSPRVDLRWFLLLRLCHLNCLLVNRCWHRFIVFFVLFGRMVFNYFNWWYWVLFIEYQCWVCYNLSEKHTNEVLEFLTYKILKRFEMWINKIKHLTFIDYGFKTDVKRNTAVNEVFQVLG